ncbi:DEAD/DEAH box helicase [Candidatus Woesearchaeota archaeon]|nr:DEAD/DEAH box helicase [Candidatus Woesearchaeota archaeon]
MNTFEELGLNRDILESIKRQGIETPTLIQEKSMPHVLKGKDVIGESATGSGKTLAFGAGIAENVQPGKGLQALVLTPTRELAEQVTGSLKTLSGKRLKIMSVYGGVSINNQIDHMPRADVVVATPGRFLDHMERGTVDLSRISILVLDEADRMLDMGFIEDVEKIIMECPKQRQTLFFSATISREISDLSSRYMRDPVQVHAQNQVDPSKMKQVYYDVTRGLKLSLLAHLLKKKSEGLSMVFCNTRRSTEFVEKTLKSNRVNAIAIHGGQSQNKRLKMISMFNSAKVGVLICTDVAARGLHIENVSHVYNFDIPNDPKDYVHRIGRTARAGEEGKVVNLLCQNDYDNFSRILDEYTFEIDNLPKPYIDRIDVNQSRQTQNRQRQGSGGRRQRRPNWNRGPVGC